MDLNFFYGVQRFIWDTHKAAENFRKHGITFESACPAILDPNVLLQDATVGNELRSAAIGFSETWALLFVVHLETVDDAIRIVSARIATSHERRAYENDR